MFKSLSYFNSAGVHVRLKNVYSVISVKLDSPPGNTKKNRIDPFVADQSAISPFLGGLPWHSCCPRPADM